MKCFYPSLDYGDVLKSKSKQTDQLPVLKCMKKIQAFLFLTKFPWVNLDWLFIPNDLCILVLGDIIMNCCSCPSQFIHKLHYSSLRLWVVGSERHLVVQQENSKCHSNAGSSSVRVFWFVHLIFLDFDSVSFFCSYLLYFPSTPSQCLAPCCTWSVGLNHSRDLQVQLPFLFTHTTFVTNNASLKSRVHFFHAWKSQK